MAIPLTDFKRHINSTQSTDDNELQTDALDPAEAWVQRNTGLSLGSGSRTFSVYASGLSLVLPVTGLASLTSVTDPDGLVLTIPARDVNLSAGVVRVPYCKPGAWTVVAGFDTAVPPDVRIATLIIAAHIWESQRGTAPSALALQSDDGLSAGPPGYAIPNRALELLAPYLTPGVA